MIFWCSLQQFDAVLGCLGGEAEAAHSWQYLSPVGVSDLYWCLEKQFRKTLPSPSKEGCCACLQLFFLKHSFKLQSVIFARTS